MSTDEAPIVAADSGEERRRDAEDLVEREVAEALGRFVIAWGTIEHELERMISTIFRVAPVQRLAISADFVIRSKIDLIKSGIVLAGPYIEDAQVKKFIGLLNKLLGLNGDIRNFIFHWSVHVNEKSEVIASKLKGGDKPKIFFYKPNKKNLDETIVKVVSLRSDLRSMVGELKTAFDSFETGWDKSQKYKEMRDKFEASKAEADLQMELPLSPLVDLS
ncbi:hypothetical protein [Methylobacterium fujisawaense]|uniref:hypothetical protein n=1 Tax=Methylobacterium fujisawaense TaxID=107400 RepID=UPI00244BA46F|nr:hypothetical protein [Methylobacterium fujisawaense]MDH3028635.1 hypothetical protein [Methylobacterium fujisawaense]